MSDPHNDWGLDANDPRVRALMEAVGEFLAEQDAHTRAGIAAAEEHANEGDTDQ